MSEFYLVKTPRPDRIDVFFISLLICIVNQNRPTSFCGDENSNLFIFLSQTIVSIKQSPLFSPLISWPALATAVAIEIFFLAKKVINLSISHEDVSPVPAKIMSM